MILVLVNGNAGWVRRQSLKRLLSEFDRVLGADGQVHVTCQADDVGNILAGIDPVDIRALVPVGGDGTLSATLAAACACWGAGRLPPVLPVRAGTMNMVAAAVLGRREPPLDTLARVVRGLREEAGAEPVRKPLLQADTGQVGFVAGFGVPTRFLAHYYDHGGGYAQALASILRYSASILRHGPLAKALFEPVPVRLSVDHQPARTLELSVLLAMTVDTLPLGFQVGLGDTGNGMTLLRGSPSPVHLVSSLPLLHRGYLPQRVGLSRSACRHLVLEFDRPQPWQLDGELLPATRRLVLDCSAQITLLR